MISNLEDIRYESRFCYINSILYIILFIVLVYILIEFVNFFRQWEIDGGIDLYPPHSLQALMRTYLIENVDMQLKHCLLIYVFLDLAMTLTQDE